MVHGKRVLVHVYCMYLVGMYCLGNGGPYDMEGFQKCLHPLKVLAKAYV